VNSGASRRHGGLQSCTSRREDGVVVYDLRLKRMDGSVMLLCRGLRGGHLERERTAQSEPSGRTAAVGYPGQVLHMFEWRNVKR
jgi:hypothetical protein